MSNIRKEIDDLQKEIQSLQNGIESRRKIIEEKQEQCAHDMKWVDTNYYWAPGHSTPGKMCTICDKFEVDKEIYPNWEITTT